MDNYTEHNAFNELRQLNELASSDELNAKIDPNNRINLEVGLSYINKRLKVVIPELLTAQEMSTLERNVVTVKSHLQNYITNSAVQNLNSAISSLIGAAKQVKNFIVLDIEGEFDFAESAEAYKSAINAEQIRLSENIELLNKILSEFELKIDNKVEKVEELTLLIAKKEEQIKNLNKEHISEFTKVKENASMHLNEGIEKIRASGLKNLEELEEQLLKAQQIVGAITTTGVTGRFQEIADKNKEAANTFRWIAIILMTILSGVLGWTLWDINIGELPWETGLVRILAAAALSYPATYAARESNKHRKIQNRNRKIELELSSFTPFIQTLNNQKKDEIREKMVDRYFSNHQEPENSNEEKLTLSGLDKIADIFVKIFQKNKI